MLDSDSIINGSKVRLCLDCGKCTVVCPVARYDTEFNPRLIVQDALKRNCGTPINEKVWSCIGCNMCVERCNYNVDFTDFIRFLRHKGWEDGDDIQYSHSGILQSAMRLMARKDTRQNRLNWLPDDIRVDNETDVAFFVGCAPYYDIQFSDLDVATTETTKDALRLLNLGQTPFKLLPNERCCGRDLLLLGDFDGFMALAQANIQSFHEKGIRKIITNCPECLYTLKVDYPRFLDDWDIQVEHLYEAIAPLIEANKIKLGHLNKKVTFHDPCTLGRYLNIYDQPRNIIESVEGLEILEMADTRAKALCCGASPWANCGFVNKQIQKERLSQAGDTGADVLITACPKCKIHLRCAQKNLLSDNVCQIEIQDLASLLIQSLSPQEAK
ncbi:(Fe-S)-binding protein [Chloroflexota bacterium]